MTTEQAILILSSRGFPTTDNGDGTFTIDYRDGGAPEVIGTQQLLANASLVIAPWWDSATHGPIPVVEDATGIPQVDTSQARLILDQSEGPEASGAFPNTEEGRTQAQAQAQAEQERTGQPHEVERDPNSGLFFVVPSDQTVGQQFQDFEEAQEAAPEGFRPTPRTLSDGSTVWTFERVPDEPDRTSSQIVDDMVGDLIKSGDMNAAAALARGWEEQTAGRMSLSQVFNLVAPVSQNPRHFAELWNSLITQEAKRLETAQVEGTLTAQDNTELQELTELTKPALLGEDIPGVGGVIGEEEFSIGEVPQRARGGTVTSASPFTDPGGVIKPPPLGENIPGVRGFLGEEAFSTRSVPAEVLPSANFQAQMTPFDRGGGGDVRGLLPSVQPPSSDFRVTAGTGEQRGGASFFSLPDNPFGEIFTRAFNKEQQRRFTSTPRPRRAFR